MGSVAVFHFYGSLQVFLSSGKADMEIAYPFSAAPAVKDAIEALGIPHPEVHKILANGSPVCFDYKIHNGDYIEVHPCENSFDSICQDGGETKRFVLDVHLGKLAKGLRMLGLDTLYENNYTDQEIAAIAAEQNRIVLTRDIGLLKHRKIAQGYWLRSQHLEEQLREIINHFQLKVDFTPLSRCLICNTMLNQVKKENVSELLPPKTKLYFHEFFQCPDCRRVYWKGSHYERMERFIKHLVSI